MLDRIIRAAALVAAVAATPAAIKAYFWIALALQALLHGWDLPAVAW